MKVRFRGPSGAGTVELGDDATVSQLLIALKEQSGAGTVAGGIAVKYGWPLQTLSPDEQGDRQVRALGLHRENLTVVPLEVVDVGTAAPTVPAAVAPAAVPDAHSASGISHGSGDHVTVAMPESRTTLVLRVMPDDGDCMFTAVGGALGGMAPVNGASFSSGSGGHSGSVAEWTPAALRSLVANTILADPVKYNANFLGMSPDRYCNNLLGGMWGGAIELSILSELFSLEIYSVDVQTGKVYQFGEQRDYGQFAVVIYSGIHYDRVAEATMEDALNMVEFDVTRWNVVGNEHIVRRSQELSRILRGRHYYTNVSDFVVSCNNCSEILQGEKAITAHARLTGHSGVTEIQDTE
ncbi:hypothetical protein F5Y17DRAFT_427970 [Xylariaceae sp. FL0594]|nr:hypothetical protein F5Y17DRAFT_427970 [Xylariaceae sp. FL0594]